MESEWQIYATAGFIDMRWSSVVTSTPGASPGRTRARGCQQVGQVSGGAAAPCGRASGGFSERTDFWASFGKLGSSYLPFPYFPPFFHYCRLNHRQSCASEEEHLCRGYTEANRGDEFSPCRWMHSQTRCRCLKSQKMRKTLYTCRRRACYSFGVGTTDGAGGQHLPDIYLTFSIYRFK